ncbi:MAG: FtsW/RodA/SpoVE family cell cycle protein [bacterium]|nr:FtsW/RodA/SpoVE family cell cycle protein [bacterium]
MLKKMDKWLLLFTLILFAIGLVMVFSASNVTAFMRYNASPYRFLYKQSLFLFVGIVLSIFMLKVSSKGYAIASWPLMLVFTGLLGFVLLYGKTTNHATSWIPIGPFTLQPSEFIKVISIVWMSSFYELKKDKLDSYMTSLFPPFICIISFVLIIFQPDLGTAIIFGLIVAFIFFLSPIPDNLKKKCIFIILGGITIVSLLLIGNGKELISSRQLSRFDFSNPCSEEKFYTDGNQVCNSYIAVNNGGLTGKGLGNSTQKYLYLPEAHTDFIFAILLEELGLIAGIAVIFLYFLTLVRIVVIGRRSKTTRGMLMCYCVAFYIFLHVVINLMGIFGLMPMTGVPLPFISYGGSFTICLVAALTIVQKIAIESKA